MSDDRGRCSALRCWYTLPLDDDGLVVPHSESGTLDVCEGTGRAPLPARPVLVARCTNYLEDVDAPCAGLMRFRWGQSEAACHACGARCGVAVADWLRVKHPDGPDDGVATAREAVARWLHQEDPRLNDSSEDERWVDVADRLLSLPEVQALIGGQPLSRSALTVTR